MRVFDVPLHRLREHKNATLVASDAILFPSMLEHVIPKGLLSHHFSTTKITGVVVKSILLKNLMSKKPKKS